MVAPSLLIRFIIYSPSPVRDYFHSFGWAVKKAGSLLRVTLAHGLTDIMLFLKLSFLLGYHLSDLHSHEDTEGDSQWPDTDT
jgi:hypothetical protein